MVKGKWEMNREGKNRKIERERRGGREKKKGRKKGKGGMEDWIRGFKVRDN